MASTIPLAKKQACEELGAAIGGDMGAIVEKHETMIMQYYNDVLIQANRSFTVAVVATLVGFGILISSFFREPSEQVTPHIVSGALIEFIAAIAFWLYARGAKQFGAFHICLERTHRYLLAFKIAETAGAEKEKALHQLVCIMANAPMITQDRRDDLPARVAAALETGAD